MQSLAIILLCVGSAVSYGIVHDQITARICIEYFTIGHPMIFPTTDPTLLGIGWGIIATWWAGLLVGILLAIVARAGSRPKRSVSALVPPVAKLMAGMALCALAAGTAGWLLGSRQLVFLNGPIARSLPVERHVPFLTALWAHLASYAAGFLGAAVLAFAVWRSRDASAHFRPEKIDSTETSM